MNNRNILLLGGALTVAGVVGFGGYMALDDGGSANSGHQAAQAAESTEAAVERQAEQLAQAGAEELLSVQEGDRVLGDPDAPVTIIEYSSLTCPHCARFHVETLPSIKENWIDSGRAKLVYRHYPLDRVALAAAQVANCLDGRAHFGFLDILFQDQANWSRAEDPLSALERHARLAGLSGDAVRSCAADEGLRDDILARQLAGRDALEVQSTPTFFVNGRKVEGAQPYDTFEAVLEEAYEEAGGAS